MVWQKYMELWHSPKNAQLSLWNTFKTCTGKKSSHTMQNLRCFFFFHIFLDRYDCVQKKSDRYSIWIPFLRETPIKSGHRDTIYSDKKRGENEMCWGFRRLWDISKLHLRQVETLLSSWRERLAKSPCLDLEKRWIFLRCTLVCELLSSLKWRSFFASIPCHLAHGYLWNLQ